MANNKVNFLLIEATDNDYYITVDLTVYTHYNTVDILVVHGESR